MHMVTPNAANFVWKTNLGLEGSTQNSAKKIAQKTCIFGPKTPFPCISAILGSFYGLFVPFLT